MLKRLYGWLEQKTTWRIFVLVLVLFVCSAAFRWRDDSLQAGRSPDGSWRYGPGWLASYLGALGENRGIYALSELTLDLIFPLVYGTLLGWLAVRVLSEGIARVVVGVVLGVVLADLGENFTLAGLTWTYASAGSPVWDAFARLASAFTYTKWVLVTGVAFVLLLGLAVALCRSWAWFLGPLVQGVGVRLGLLLPVVIGAAVATGAVGADYGLPALFWHERWELGALAALGATLFLLEVCFVALLLDSMPLHRPERVSATPPDWASATGPLGWLLPDGGAPDPIWDQLRAYLARSWLLLLLLLCLFSLSQPPAKALAFTGGVVAGLALVSLSAWARYWANGFGKQPAATPSANGEAPSTATPTQWVAWHAGVAVAFLVAMVLTARYCPASPQALCLLLSLWLAGHGALLFYRELHLLTDPSRRHLHVLAGFGSLVFFVLYQILFLVWWFSPDVAEQLVPPALVFFLLLALIVLLHGFLTYSFNGWYVLGAVALLVVLGWLSQGMTTKLQFPEMDYSHKVSLLQGDFEGTWERLRNRQESYQTEADADAGKALRERLLLLYEQLQAACKSLEKRYLRLQEDLGRKAPSAFGELPSVSDVEKALQSSDNGAAERLYRQARQRYDYLHDLMMASEFEALKRWREHARKDGQLPKLAVVAVSGGASRAALWTTVVLNRVEEAFAKDAELKQLGFPRHVRLITGASGGMVGACYWTATLEGTTPGHQPAFRAEAEANIAQDSLTPVGQSTLFQDLPTVVLPFPFSTDRGIALEKTWERNLSGALAVPFRSLSKPEASGSRPSLVVSPMLVEDGRRLLISNRYLPFLTDCAGASLSGAQEGAGRAVRVLPSKEPGRPRPAGKPLWDDPNDPTDADEGPRVRYSSPAVEFFQLFPGEDRFTLATAARMSATFPYISPAVDLPTTPRRRVVDAGYYDNYGVSVAAAWVYAHRRWIRKNTSGVVLIQVRDSVSEDRRLFPDVSDPREDRYQMLEWLTGPLAGARSAREARMSFRNDEQVQALGDWFNTDQPEFFTTVVFESAVPAAMNWYLRQDEAASIRGGFEPVAVQGVNKASANREALDNLVRWWKRPGRPD